MNAEILANSGQNLENQIRGGFGVSNLDANPEAIDVGKVEAGKALVPEAPSAKSNPFLERIKTFFERSPHDNILPPTVPWDVSRRAAETRARGANAAYEVPFGEVWNFSRTMNSLHEPREAEGKGKIHIFGIEVEQMRSVLKYCGMDAEEVEGMQDPEVIAAMQFALPKITAGEAQDSDFGYQTTAKEKLDARVSAFGEIKKAREQGRLLTPDEIAELVVFEELGKIAGAAPVEIEQLDPKIMVAEVEKYIRQIQRANTRPIEVRLKKFQEIESEMDRALLRGELTAHDDVDTVRDALSKRIDQFVAESMTTPPAEDLLTSMPEVKTLLSVVTEKTVTDPDWTVAKNRLQTIIQRCNTAVEDLVSKKLEDVKERDVKVDADGTDVNIYRYVFEVAKAIGDFEKFVKEPARRLKLLQAFDGGGRSGIENLNLFLKQPRDPSNNLLAKVDRFYTKFYENHSKDQQQIILGDINEKANYYVGAILGGWRDLNTATREVMGMGHMKGEQNELGIREWRSTRYFQRLVDAVRISQLTQRPADWEDVAKHLSSMYSYVEDSGVGSDELGPLIQRANGLIESMPAETHEGRDRRLELTRQLDAFKAWHLLIITADDQDMNPEGMLKVFSQYFNGREERTLEDFVARFGRDDRARSFYIAVTKPDGSLKLDQNGHETYEKVNLFDIQHGLYSDRLRDERIMMNMIEEMTNFPIENPFDFATINKIKQRVGFDGLPREWKAKWQNELEKLREHLVKKMKAKIDTYQRPGGKWAGRAVRLDDVWGQLGGIDASSGEIDRKEFIKETFKVVEEWHTKRTLHGAFGTISNEDTGELSAQIKEELDGFGIDRTVYGNLITENNLLGKSFLEIRREIMQMKLRHILEERKLKVNRDLGDKGMDLKDAEMGELDEIGFFGSVDYNAYNWAWINQWSNYDTIRIYSRGKREKPDKKDKFKLDDDFEMVTFHKSTNLFNARHTDHAWEFFHENNENRGRAKENDVNRIWKQRLPGKHHYVFPHHTMMVRFAEKFLTPEQKAYLERRALEMMAENDFDNVKWHDEFKSWMKGVVLMDMIENGWISFGQKNFSEIVKDKVLTKFAGIDVSADRKKLKDYLGPEAFQDYLAAPSNEKFVEVNEKKGPLPSTRDPRQHAWMVQAARCHLEVVMKHLPRLFDAQNQTSVSAETLLDTLVLNGDMEKESGVHEKRKWCGFQEIKIGGSWGIPEIKTFKLPEFFGTTPFRRARQKMEEFRRAGWDSKYLLLWAFWAGFLAGVAELVKQFPKQALPQMR